MNSSSLKPIISTNQNFIRMKWFTLLLGAFLLQLTTSASAQQVTLDVRDTPLEKVLSAVEAQTGYSIVANYALIRTARPVTVHVRQVPLERFLESVLKERKLDYTIRSKTITITRLQDQEDNKPAAGAEPAAEGIVTDSSGAPLPGATIAVKGSPVVATADAYGRFSIRAKPGNELMATFIGFRTATAQAPAAGMVRFVLIPVAEQLGEHVVEVHTGYQTLKKTQLTGAFSVLDRQSYLQSVPVSGNIVENMEGRIAGLMLKTNASSYDAQNTSPFSIRGVSTFQAIKKPLIVLNGYPTEVDIETLNPYDIENITVLKDAAAAAIYGVRASNGVVVVNTRKGVNSKTQFHLNTALTYKPRPDFSKLKLVGGRGYVDFERASSINTFENDGLSKEMLDMLNGTYTPVFSITDDLYNGRITAAQAEQEFAKYAAYDNTKDFNELFYQNQLLSNIDFSMNGGNAQANYFVGVSRVDNRRSERFSKFDKTTVNLRGTYNFMKIFTMDLQSIYSNQNSGAVPIPQVTDFKPYQRFRDEAGNALPAYLSPYTQNFFGFYGMYGTLSGEGNRANMDLGLYDSYYYPYQEMFESSDKNSSNVYRLQGNLRAKIAKGLQLEAGGVFERSLSSNVAYASEQAYQTRLMLNYYADRDPFTGKPVFRMPQGATNKTRQDQLNAYTLRAQALYNRTFGDVHDFSLLAGMEVRRLTTSSKLSTAFGYDPNTLTIKPVNLSLIGNRQVIPAFADVLVPGIGYIDDYTRFSDYFNETWQDDRFVSGYANGAYTYDSRYSLTGSLRIDQSNLFGNDPRFRYTPLWSAGFSWNLQNEKFMQPLSWINEAKLRLSAGYNGNIIKLSGPYTILSAGVNNLVPNDPVGYSIRTLRNNQLRWEKTLNYNAGLDFAVLDRRVSGTVDFYVKKGRDIFSNLEIDATKGASNALVNNASILNKGLDVSITTVNATGKNFTWRTQLTGSFNQSKVLNVTNKYSGFFDFVRVGYPENQIGYPISAVFAHNYLGLNEKGQPTVRGEDGKPVVLSYTPRVDVPFNSLKFVGVNDPRYVLGMNNAFTVHDLTLSFLIMYYGGNVARVAPPSIYDERPVEGVEHVWKQPGDEATTNIPGFPAPYGSPDYYGVRIGYDHAGQFYRKMDFLALRNVTLAWNLNEKLAKKMHLLQPRVILQVQNPYKFVFSGNDVDPESLDYISGRRGLPVLPAYTLSFNINF